jgi:hypothetical protein
MKTNNSSGGMLLYTIITTMVVSLIAVTFVLISLNRYRIADNECKRQEAIQLAKAGFVYVYEQLANGVPLAEVSMQLPGHPEVIVNIDNPDPTGISAYRIRSTVQNYELR